VESGGCKKYDCFEACDKCYVYEVEGVACAEATGTGYYEDASQKKTRYWLGMLSAGAGAIEGRYLPSSVGKSGKAALEEWASKAVKNGQKTCLACTTTGEGDIDDRRNDPKCSRRTRPADELCRDPKNCRCENPEKNTGYYNYNEFHSCRCGNGQTDTGSCILPTQSPTSPTPAPTTPCGSCCGLNAYKCEHTGGCHFVPVHGFPVINSIWNNVNRDLSKCPTPTPDRKNCGECRPK